MGTLLLHGLLLAALHVDRCAAGPVRTRVWRLDESNMSAPEAAIAHLQGRDDFGVALAGGGLRGTALAQGAVRALRDTGLLDRAKYLSLTSGSVWHGIPLYFQHLDSLDELLGNTLPPQELTPEVLVGATAGTQITRLGYPVTKYPKGSSSTEQSTHQQLNQSSLQNDSAILEAYQGCNGVCDCLAEALLPELHGLWEATLAGVIMNAFKINEYRSVYCHELHCERIINQFDGFTSVYKSNDVRWKLPFLVSQSSILAEASGLDSGSNPLVSYPLENTLLWTGVPVSFPKGKLLGPAENYEALGGAVVEPHAFSGSPMEPVPAVLDGSAEMLVDRSPDWVNWGALAAWAAQASCYAADYQIRPWVVDAIKKDFTGCLIPAIDKFIPHADIWSPYWKSEDTGIPWTVSAPVADAGIYDDMGHLPLLRRKVKKMVIYDSSAVHDTEQGRDASDLEEMVYLKAAFGAPGFLKPANPAGSPNPMMVENFTTVFDPAEFAPLWQEMQDAVKQGEPAVVRGKYTVVDNPHLGVVGGWQVEIVWVVLLPSATWMKALPAASRDKLHDYFPNYLASESKSQMELSAMAHYAAWLTEQRVAQEIKAMLDDVDADALLV